MSSLVACPSCACHIERTETECPHCGAGVAPGPSLPLTRGAVVLGLAAATLAGGALAACGDDVQSDYGAGASTSEGGGAEGGGAEGGAGGEGGAVQSDYGAGFSQDE